MYSNAIDPLRSLLLTLLLATLLVGPITVLTAELHLVGILVVIEYDTGVHYNLTLLVDPGKVVKVPLNTSAMNSSAVVSIYLDPQCSYGIRFVGTTVNLLRTNSCIAYTPKFVKLRITKDVIIPWSSIFIRVDKYRPLPIFSIPLLVEIVNKSQIKGPIEVKVPKYGFSVIELVLPREDPLKICGEYIAITKVKELRSYVNGLHVAFRYYKLWAFSDVIIKNPIVLYLSIKSYKLIELKYVPVNSTVAKVFTESRYLCICPPWMRPCRSTIPGPLPNSYWLSKPFVRFNIDDLVLELQTTGRYVDVGFEPSTRISILNDVVIVHRGFTLHEFNVTLFVGGVEVLKYVNLSVPGDRLVLELKPTTFEVYLEDIEGNPLRDATVYLVNAMDPSIVLSSNASSGLVMFSNVLPGCYILVIKLGNYTVYRDRISIGTSSTSIKVKLDVVQLRVRLRNVGVLGRLCLSRELELMIEGKDLGYVYKVPVKELLSSSTVIPLPVNHSYVASLTWRGHVLTKYCITNLTTSTDVVLVVPVENIVIYLRDLFGSPVEDAVVEVLLDGEVIERVSTSDEGSVFLSIPKVESVRLRVISGKFVKFVNVPSHSTELQVVIPVMTFRSLVIAVGMFLLLTVAVGIIYWKVKTWSRVRRLRSGKRARNRHTLDDVVIVESLESALS
ncbi:MAG: hypothetical protein DRJ40_07565 [Thermoprotei archaeon]|nr:MAG: hypothetical protein DRJ40_07565 [Thermoprotei archaeon]